MDANTLPLANLSQPIQQALLLLANTCTDSHEYQSHDAVFWSLFAIFLCIFVVVCSSSFFVAWQMAEVECRAQIRELRNTPSHQLHQALETEYVKRVGIQKRGLENVERYPSVSFVNNPVTMTRTITVVEDLAWVVPVDRASSSSRTSGASSSSRASERELSREQEEIGLILRGLGLENDQEAKPGNGMTRIGDEPPAYEAQGPGSLWKYRGCVNP